MKSSSMCAVKKICLFYGNKEQPACQLSLDKHTLLASSFCWEEEQLQLLALHNKMLISLRYLLTTNNNTVSHLTTFLLSFCNQMRNLERLIIMIFQCYSSLGSSSKTLYHCMFLCSKVLLEQCEVGSGRELCGNRAETTYFLIPSHCPACAIVPLRQAYLYILIYVPR